MAVHYHVPDKETLLIRGPANVTVKGGQVPVIGTGEDLTNAMPTITSLDPAEAESGSADVTMTVNGTNFNDGTTIVFGQHDEPTTFVSDTQVSTGVKPSLFAPATVPVKVRNGPATSESLDFTFTEPAGATRSKKS